MSSILEMIENKNINERKKERKKERRKELKRKTERKIFNFRGKRLKIMGKDVEFVERKKNENSE